MIRTYTPPPARRRPGSPMDGWELRFDGGPRPRCKITEYVLYTSLGLPHHPVSVLCSLISPNLLSLALSPPTPAINVLYLPPPTPPHPAPRRIVPFEVSSNIKSRDSGCDTRKTTATMLWTRKPATFPAIEVRSLLHPTAQNVPLVCNRQPLSSPTPPGRASPPGTPRAQSALENASPTHEALERSSMSSNAPPEEAEVGEIDSSTARRARLSRTRTKSKTSRRPHICSICPQSFTRAEHLIRHERSRK